MGWLRSLSDVSTIRVAACQINTVVGDLEGNAERVVEALDRVADVNLAASEHPGVGATAPVGVHR